ncbi:MAG: hypothetical protein P8Y64_05070 [Gammaproteobacteria bacterium]|jgi:hypothetical protein
MDSSPITSWAGATVYYTFAHNPWVIGLILTLSVIVTFGVVASMLVHEKHSFHRIKNGG